MEMLFWIAAISTKFPYLNQEVNLIVTDKENITVTVYSPSGSLLRAKEKSLIEDDKKAIFYIETWGYNYKTDKPTEDEKNNDKTDDAADDDESHSSSEESGSSESTSSGESDSTSKDVENDASTNKNGKNTDEVQKTEDENSNQTNNIKADDSNKQDTLNDHNNETSNKKEENTQETKQDSQANTNSSKDNNVDATEDDKLHAEDKTLVASNKATQGLNVWGLDSHGLYCGCESTAAYNNKPFKLPFHLDGMSKCNKDIIIQFPNIPSAMTMQALPGFGKNVKLFAAIKKPDGNYNQYKNDEKENQKNTKIEPEDTKNTAENPTENSKTGEKNDNTATKLADTKKPLTNLTKNSKAGKTQMNVKTSLDEDDDDFHFNTSKLVDNNTDNSEEFYQIRFENQYFIKGKTDPGVVLNADNTDERTKFTIEQVNDYFLFKQGNLKLGVLDKASTPDRYLNIGDFKILNPQFKIQKAK